MITCRSAAIALISGGVLGVTMPVGVHAGASVPRPAIRDAFPPTTAMYPTSSSAAAPGGSNPVRGGAVAADEVLRRPEGLINGAGAMSADLGSSGQRSWWPLLYSVLVPGAGEWSMGYKKRGAALIVAEAVAWTGYFIKRSDGLDKRHAYESFADANWTTQKWLADHPLFPGTMSIDELDRLGSQSSGSGAWPGYNPWVSKSEDKQHYYENIGKYDWYISGWSDYDPSAPTQQRDTALRDQYRAMRIASNHALDTSNRFIYLSVAARVFSVVETLLIIHSSRNPAEEQARVQDNHWRIDAAAHGIDGGHLALEYHFR